jgi:PAS domain S-box-containing protein
MSTLTATVGEPVHDAAPPERVRELAEQAQNAVYRRTDRVFAGLLVFEWVAAVALAVWVSPLTWAGSESRTHPHVVAALLLGGLIASLPVGLALARPGWVVTRHTIAVGQMMMSALLIHLTGGRIETHFHVFGSLAFLAFYRDWRVLITATVVVAADHVIRGFVWPESVYGTAVGATWRWVEHAWWVVFEDVFLIYACVIGVRDIQATARRRAALEAAHATVELQVEARTRELRESAQAVRRGRDEMGAILETAHDAFVMADASGRIIAWNRQAEATLGWTREEVLGRSLTDTIIPPAFREAHRAGFERFLATGHGPVLGRRLELSALHREGRELPIEITISAVQWGGERCFAAFLHDITERKRAEEELRAAKGAAEAANRAKSEFLANMSHEIRTPMNGILGMTDLLLEGDLTREQRESLGLVKSSADALLGVINDILDFSKIEAGKLDLDPTPLFLRDLVGDTLKALAYQAHEKGLELACDLPPNVPDLVIADPVRLRQVLTNLVGNAIKFTERGEVVVRAALLETRDDRYRLRFAVSDTGIGIPANKLKAIFDPFTQADGSTTRKFGGTGLGLTICARLVEIMGGRIWAESELGKGSTFQFEIQLERARGSIERRVPVPADLRGLPVLVVDDNATNRRVLEETLRLWGATPTCVDSGQAALDELARAAAAQQRYAAVLLDAMMPGMDGFEVAERVAKNPAIGAPILMLTSADRKGDAARSRALGIAAYLVKPVKPNELNLALAVALPAAAAEIVYTAPRSGRDANGVRRLRILVAEDNPVNQRVAIRLLEKGGHAVTLANHGGEAVVALDRGEFDLVLMDVQMPEMDGFEATRVIREREAGTGRHIPIVAMTAHAMKGDRERCLAAGMDDYLAKPVQRSELDRVLAWVAGAPATAPKESAPAEPVAFDRTSALERLGGDEALFAEVAGLFLTDAPQQLEDIRRAVAARDAGALRRAAHSLKGAAAYVGGMAASSVAHRLELLGAENDLRAAPDALKALDHEINRLTSALNTVLQPVTT